MRPRLASGTIVAVLVAACGAPPDAQCNADSDCDQGARCRGGVCGVDAIAPGRIVDLAVDAAVTGAQSLTLTFTAPGDDGFAPETRPDQYVVHAVPQGDGAEQTVTLDASALAGQRERLVVEGLFRGTRYLVSVDAVDAAGNASPSNSIATETGGALCLDEDGVLVARGNVFRVTRPEHLVRLVGCERIEATLLIEDVDCVIESLAALTSLTSVTSLGISGNALCGTGLEDLDDLAALESGDVTVSSYGTLVAIELPSLVAGSLFVTDNPLLERVAAPALLEGSIELSFNNRLGDVDLGGLATAGSVTVVATAPLDLDLPALSSSAAIGLSGDVALSMPLTDIAGSLIIGEGVRALDVPALRTITGRVAFQGAALPEVSWALERIDGSLVYSGVADAIELPSSLTSIDGQLTVQGGDVPSLAFDAVVTGFLTVSDVPALTALPPLRVEGPSAFLDVRGTGIASIDVTLAGSSLQITDNGGVAPAFFASGISSNAELRSVTVRGNGSLIVNNNADIALDAAGLSASTFNFSNNTGTGEVRVAAAASTSVFMQSNIGFTSFVLDDTVSSALAFDSFFVSSNEGLEDVVIEPAVVFDCESQMQIDTVATVTFGGSRIDMSCPGSFFFFAGASLSGVSTFSAPNMTTASVTVPDAFGVNGGIIQLNGAVALMPVLTSITVTVNECFGFLSVPFFAGAGPPLPAQNIVVNGCADFVPF